MEYLTQLFLPISIWFQSAPAWVLTLMKGITFLGNTEFYLLVMPLLYWCIDLSLGIRIGIILLVSGGLNNILKLGFASPRPFWVSPKVQGMVEATGFGFPSGHAQNAASIWGLLAASVRQSWLKILAMLLILLIGLSRIILGVHFTHDVLVGWLVGLILLFIFLKLEEPVKNWFRDNSLGKQLLALVLVTAVFILPALLIISPFNPPPLPEIWVKNMGEQISPYNYEDLLTTSGSFFGLGLGVILLNQTGWFKTGGPAWKLALRYLVGLAGVLALYLGLGAVFPHDISFQAYLLRFLRYTLIGFWISYGGPRVFGWLRLTSS